MMIIRQQISSGINTVANKNKYVRREKKRYISWRRGVKAKRKMQNVIIVKLDIAFCTGFSLYVCRVLYVCGKLIEDNLALI